MSTDVLRYAESGQVIVLPSEVQAKAGVLRGAAAKALRIMLQAGALVLPADVSAQEPIGQPVVAERQEEAQPLSKERWVQAHVKETRAQIRRCIRMMDAPKFDVRMQGNRELLSTYREFSQSMHPYPPELMELFDHIDDPKNATFEGMDLSPEQRVRLQSARKNILEEEMFIPDRMPPAEYSMDDCLEMIQAQTGFRLNIDPDQRALLPKQLVINTEQNGCYAVLVSLVRKTGGRIVADNDPRVLNIVSADESDGIEHEYFCDGKVLGIVTKQGEKGMTTALRMSPNHGMLAHMEKAGAEQEGTIALHPLSTANWMMSSGVAPTRSRTATKGGDGIVSATCSVVRKPTVRTLKMDEMVAAGFQRILVEKPDEEEPLTVKVDIVVCGELPWPATPCSFDTKSYGASEATGYRFFDAKGEEIKATPVACNIMQRKMVLTFTCDRQPASASVQAYEEFWVDEEVRLGEEDRIR